MNQEDIYDGVTDVRDDLVEAAAPKKRALRLWMPLAAAAAVVLAVTALWPRIGGTAGGKASPYLLSAAVYPEQAPYPRWEDFIQEDGDIDYEAFSEADDKFFQDQHDRWESLSTQDGTLDGFYQRFSDFTQRSMAQLLSGGEGENRVCSPVNLYMALAMLAETTGGNSREQILQLVGYEDMESLRAVAGRVFHGIYQDNGLKSVIPANSLWLNENVHFVQSTMDTLAQEYYASSYRGEMGSAGLNQALQDWINDQTSELLAEQAEGLSLEPETILALVSTLYFKARWFDEFSPENTAPDVFHAPSGDVTADFMRQAQSGGYYWGEHFSAITKSFIEYDSMWFILPDEGVDVEALLTDPEVADMLHGREWKNSKYVDINLSMPKFDVSSDLDLTESLKALGITDVFDPSLSDFSPMTKDADEIYLSQARHAARVLVDEEGCQAAAYNIMADVGMGGPPDEEVDFVLDRPFLFVITSDVGSLPLFAGIVNQP
ncbi:MAG: serpin family protein [Oscillibacter sp.]|nr:serpin family protein [Oscillibacter sp.]